MDNATKTSTKQAAMAFWVFAALGAAAVMAPAAPARAGGGSNGGASSIYTEDDTRKQIAGFIEEWATMHGALAACEPKEAEILRLCSTEILNRWHDVTGMPAVTDRNFRAEIGDRWQTYSEHATQMQISERPDTCGHIVALSRASKLWEICERPQDSPDSARQAPGQAGKPNSADRVKPFQPPIQIQ